MLGKPSRAHIPPRHDELWSVHCKDLATVYHGAVEIARLPRRIRTFVKIRTQRDRVQWRKHLTVSFA